LLPALTRKSFLRKTVPPPPVLPSSPSTATAFIKSLGTFLPSGPLWREDQKLKSLLPFPFLPLPTFCLRASKAMRIPFLPPTPLLAFSNRPVLCAGRAFFVFRPFALSRCLFRCAGCGLRFYIQKIGALHPLKVDSSPLSGAYVFSPVLLSKLTSLTQLPRPFNLCTFTVLNVFSVSSGNPPFLRLLPFPPELGPFGCGRLDRSCFFTCSFLSFSVTRHGPCCHAALLIWTHAALHSTRTISAVFVSCIFEFWSFVWISRPC